MIITKKEADKIIKCKEQKLEMSLDMGVSNSTISIVDDFVIIQDSKIPLEQFAKVKDDAFYLIEDNQLKKLAMFSDETNFYYKLVPTSDWPTITLSSTPMHRHTKISPKKDTITKIKEISPLRGNILDTCCGLGYTAIMASKNAKIHTFERDKNVLEMAKFNRYSNELFTCKNIKLIIGDVFDGITKFKDNFFDRIIHDPPTFKYSPELYSNQFYKELYRVLKNKGILYHYAPWVHKTRGRVFYRKIIADLADVGFSDINYNDNSSGVIAVKNSLSAN